MIEQDAEDNPEAKILQTQPDHFLNLYALRAIFLENRPTKSMFL